MKHNATKTPLVTGTRFPGGSRHEPAVKLAAVRDVKQLMLEGISKWKALKQIAKTLTPTISAAALSNWYNNYDDVTVNLQRSNGNVTHTNRFTLRSVNIRTVNGHDATLTSEDIHQIAEWAGSIC